MKKTIIFLLLTCLLLGCAQAALAAPEYEYPTRDFYQKEIPQPRPFYIPDGTPVIDMVAYNGASNFDREAFINSTYGELSSLWLATNYSGYSSGMDEKLLAYWKDQGIVKEGFGLDTEDIADDYYVYTPADAETGEVYPLLIVNHGGGSNCFDVEGMGYVQMIPEEQFILATAEDTSVESLHKMYEAVTSAYPVDTTRVYAAGTSMGGMASLNIAATYPELITAIAPNDIAPSISFTDEEIARMQQYVVPMNFTTGLADTYAPFPMTQMDFSGNSKVDGYNKLLKLLGFEEYSMTSEEVDQLVEKSMDVLEYATGLRLPNVTLVNYTNNRLYVSDFVNADGVTLLRINVVENKPHMIVGMDAQNAWDFLKQFSREAETGALIVAQ